MKKLIKGTHHINLRAKGEKNFDETVAFYREVLGMEEVRSWRGKDGSPSIMLNTGNSLMEIGAGDDALDQGSIRHFALATDDVDACVERVREAGYPITKEPRDAVLRSDPPLPIRIAFCIGPCGEEIEFFCEKEG